MIGQAEWSRVGILDDFRWRFKDSTDHGGDNETIGDGQKGDIKATWCEMRVCLKMKDLNCLNCLNLAISKPNVIDQ